MKHTIFLTGAAGYIGGMLVRKLAAREDVERIVGLDKEPLPEFISGIDKLTYLQANTSDAWEQELSKYSPDIVIHAAWQIREMYGDQKTQWKWNVEGSDRIFDFAFSQPSVKRLVYFSTVASYGSYPDNEIEHRFTEDEPFRPSDYLYAEEKRVVEMRLEQKYAEAKQRGTTVEVAIVRPAAITGPRGRFMRIRFGLQAALSGQLRESFIHRVVTAMVSFVPVTKKWCRQFIHEDDVVDIVEMLALSPLKKPYDAFNICPPGDVVRGPDMARAVGKRMIRMHPYLIRLAFFFMWHLSRGKVPTSRGSWKGYSYPIAVSGEKLTREYGYRYRGVPYEAFFYTDGRYQDHVPEVSRRSKPA